MSASRDTEQGSVVGSGSAGRLDKAMQQRGLTGSRTRAAQLIAAGEVSVDGIAVTKASTLVGPAQQITVRSEDPWVSRAAHKLLGALDACPQISVAGRRCLDAGASTGGFTQVLVSRGAGHVTSVDVGRDQMSPRIAADQRVRVVEGMNLRHVSAGDLGEPFELIVTDLSFISLRLVLGPLSDQAAEGAHLLLMVKPQFEVGRQRIGRTGVVTSPELRREAVASVVAEARRYGLGLVSVERSPIEGQDGNAEFFVHLMRSVPHDTVGAKPPSGIAGSTAAKLDRVDYT